MAVISNSAFAMRAQACARLATALFVVATLQVLSLTGLAQNGARRASMDVPEAKASDEESTPKTEARRDPFAALREEAMRSLAPANPPTVANPSAGRDTIGGSVVDGDGLPIQGAKIEVRISAPSIGFANPATAPGYVDLAPGKTDPKGIWMVAHVPAGAVLETSQSIGTRGEKYSVLVTHPEFLSERFSGTRTSSAVQDSDFRKKAARVVLKRGVVLRGMVRDEQGRGIVGATIQRNIGEYDPRAITDEEGRYVLKSARPGDFVVRARGRGFALQQQRVVLSSNQTVDFTLQPAHTITLILQDARGQPVTEGQVNFMPVATKWLRGDRFWVAYPSRSGRVVWNEAPPGEVIAGLNFEGFQRINKTVAADSQALITLQPTAAFPVITLKVTSGETGKPLAGCTIEPGLEFGAPQRTMTVWQAPLSRVSGTLASKPGEYVARVSEFSQRNPLVFRVRCHGHAPLITAPIDVKQGSATIAVALTPREPTEIVVTKADGTSGANATVQVCWTNHSLAPAITATVGLTSRFAEFAMSRRKPEFSGTTGNDGRCLLPACADAAAVLVADDASYALISYSDLLKDPSVRLKPCLPGEDRLLKLMLPAEPGGNAAPTTPASK